jgi:hypothetical protein
MLELTVRADPRQLAPVRHRIGALLRALHRTDDHIWRVSVVANELLALSIHQGNDRGATLRLLTLPDATRIELVDDLQDLAAFESEPGRIVTRVASIWGVVRDPAGTRTVWCDVEREP